ncbi:LysM peptidoglycan-binding domain-containing protein [Acinetobacter brisouii]|uniref:LysM peptidoglycan-binding domain-containing protein n=1 Tax=Acinetobacter brisouii TaxID=396323 RepID=UPI000698089E|nr:LysM peptidoglycan-binding domain-containing protein [Acinetobacter brisouii]
MTVAKDKLYDITFILHDLTHKPIANLYYEIKNQQDMVKKGMTNAQGEISLKYVGGNILTVFVRKAHDQKMKQIGEIHTPNKNIKVKMISPKMKFDVTLLPQGNQGKYWRCTYKVKKGDTLSKIAKEHHTTVSALLALNPSIKSPNQIYQNQAIELGESNDNAVLKLDEHSVIKVPPAKKTTGHVISDRKSTGGSSSSTTATPQAKQQTSTTQVEHKSASPQVQPSPTPSKSVTQKTPQPTTAKKTSIVATTTTTPQKIAVQQEHNENKKPVAVASLSGCVCKQYDLIWGAKVNCEFRKKVVAIASELWGEKKKIKMANMLMAVFAWESGFTFRADAPNQSNSGGTGLIQIMPKTFRAITGEEPIIEKVTNYWGKPKKGKPDIELRRIKQLAKLTPAQYLDYVKKYFEPQKGKKLEFIDFYLLVLFPVSSGKPEHVVFADNISKIPQGEEESIRQKRVNAFPKNNMDGYIIDDKGNAVKKGVKDGKVMKSEIAIAVSHYLKDGENYKSNYLDGCSIKPKNIKSSNSLIQKAKASKRFLEIPSNYWILGERSIINRPNQFDDNIYLMKGEQVVKKVKGTTHPGVPSLKNPDAYNSAKTGSPVWDFGWHYKVWKQGKHKNKINAFVQVGSAYIIRDTNRDTIPGNSGVSKIEIGKGLNFHPASYKANGSANVIGTWSTGCVVVQSATEYYSIYNLIVSSGQNILTFCVISGDI